MKPSFWTTAPGVITALATLITAVGGLLGVLFTAGVFDGGSGGETPTPFPNITSTPPTATRDLAVNPQLSAQAWKSKGGSTAFLDVSQYSYRAGISHVEDLPPAGESIAVISFNLGQVDASDISRAELDLRPSDVVGDPYKDFGALVVEEVSFGDLSQVLATSPIQELSRLTVQPSSPIDVTAALTDAVRRGATRFQIRMRFAGVLLPDVEAELAASDSYMRWDNGPRLTLTVIE